MPVVARKTTEKRGKKGKKGTRDFFPCGKKYHVPFFPVPFFPKKPEAVGRSAGSVTFTGPGS
jgi:hypothetical protein